MENKIIAIVGMCGSGKSVLADELMKLGTFGYIRFGQITLDILKEKGLELNEANERTIREDVRKEYGMGAYATLNIPKFDAVLAEGKNLVADGMMSWDEYKILKEYYKDKITVIGIFAPPEMRYDRLEKRFLKKGDINLRDRPFTREQAKARDFAEIENLAKGGPIAMADYTILNTGDLIEYVKNIKNFIDYINLRK